MSPYARGKVRLTQHLQTALSTLGRLSRTPLSSAMTCAVIGITLALPAGLYLLLNNLQQLSADWDSSASLSLYLHLETEAPEAEGLMAELRGRPQISEVQMISREAAMEEFRRQSGFGGALDLLPENPLPDVLIVTPDPESADPALTEALAAELQALPEVELVQFDMLWMQRFQGLVEIATRGTLIITGLLGITVLLVVGNTVRLEIQTRRNEIEIAALVGATNAFIRRPFLYSGIWYGLIGGMIAWLLIELALGMLQGPVNRLAALYLSDFTLATPSVMLLLTLLVASTLLGLAGAWLSVGRHLVTLEPD